MRRRKQGESREYRGTGVNKKLLVFVSSTYKDLQEERQAAVQAILKAGHIPAGMELFAAGDKSQLETIYNWIDECDVYMLILGGRYGSLDKETGLSYTELEYDYARSKNKPFFSVVIKPEALEAKVRTKGTGAIETENPKLLKDFQEKVLSSMSSFFEDIKDVKLAVYESLGDFALDPELSGWISGKEVPDVAALRSEIDSLKATNATLEAKASKSRLATKNSDPIDFEELQRILISTQITIPKECWEPPKKEDVKVTLHAALLQEADRLVAGVTSYTTNEYSRYLYYSLLPKLQVLGLAENEKPPGTSTRRSYLNKDGQKYLAWLQRKDLEKV
jgi:Domain of unknown function (DUF4062)